MKISRNTKTRQDVVIDLINQVFDGAEMPRTKLECSAGGIDGPYVIKHFFGKNREEVEANFLPTLYMEDFSYMTAKAVAYYLPCVLRLMMHADEIHDYDTDLWIYLGGFLKHEIEEVRKALNKSQFEAISAWATYLHTAWDGSRLSDEADQALKLARLYQ